MPGLNVPVPVKIGIVKLIIAVIVIRLVLVRIHVLGLIVIGNSFLGSFSFDCTCFLEEEDRILHLALEFKLKQVDLYMQRPFKLFCQVIPKSDQFLRRKTWREIDRNIDVEAAGFHQARHMLDDFFPMISFMAKCFRVINGIIKNRKRREKKFFFQMRG